MKFGFLAGTGRTGTHWVQRLIQDADPIGTQAFHDGLPRRIKIKPQVQGTTNTYWQRLIQNVSTAVGNVIECNPAMPEWIALAHNVEPTQIPFPADWRAVLVVRHPMAYARSMLARTWGWGWYDLPGFDKGTWDRLDDFERICFAWVYKTELMCMVPKEPGGLLVRYGDIFNSGSAVYLKTVRGLLQHLRVSDRLTDGQLLRLRGRVFAAKGGAKIELTSAQRDTCWQMCRETAERFGYAV